MWLKVPNRHEFRRLSQSIRVKRLLSIVCESDSCLLVDKPAGWLTTPAREGVNDPRPCLGRELQKQVGYQIYPVHRLDFEVSGLTLWAKNPRSHALAQSWFEHGSVKKKYEAFSAWGESEPPVEFTLWKSNLVRGKRRTFAAPHGKPSETMARVVGSEREFRKWELLALTGRPHQLRFELSHRGFPIVGDMLYGGVAAPLKGWIALRAVELDFRAVADRLGLPEIVSVVGLQIP